MRTPTHAPVRTRARSSGLPVAGADVRPRRAGRSARIESLWQRHGFTALLVTHDVSALPVCQLFALSCNAPSAVTFSFTGFSARGGATGEHADGFGLAFHAGPACRLFVDTGRAADSPLAAFLRGHPIHARTVLAHIRKATQGAVQLSNSHPFVREWLGRHWSFCHNGDLKAFRPRLNGSFLPVGQTDSEHAFCWMLQELRRRFGVRRAPQWRELAPAIAELAERIARHGSFNFLMSDGEALYVHASTRLHWLTREHPFPTAQLVDHDLTLDLSIANGADDRMALVATEPLTRNEAWRAFSPGELRVFAAGVSVWEHKPVADEPAAAWPLPPTRLQVAT